MYTWLFAGVLALNLIMFSAGLFFGIRRIREGRRAAAYGGVMAIFTAILVCYAYYRLTVCQAVDPLLCSVFRRIGLIIFALSTFNFGVVEAFLVFFDRSLNEDDEDNPESINTDA